MLVPRLFSSADFRVCGRALCFAFTLTEMLVVMAVIAVLALLAFGSFQSAMQSSKTAGSLSNMRQLSGAFLNYAADNNNMLPNSRNPDQSLCYAWDLQLFPYLGISDGFSGSTTSPKLKPGLDLDVFRCPLDARNASPSGSFYPRSYGVTASAVYWIVPGDNQPFGGGIPGRRRGEGMRMAVVSKPSTYVILCRVGKDWEVSGNTVGVQSQSIYNGPDPMNPATWEPYRVLFGGKTPYGFADGHVALLNKQEALLVNPNTWDVNK